MLAIVEIARNARRAGGTQPGIVDAGVRALVPLLVACQDTGEFRADFDPSVMAVAIRAAIDAVPRRLADDPQLDVDHYGSELADLFTRAVSVQRRRR